MPDTGARFLYAGIVGDTGRFLFPSATLKTFETAGKLIQYNFNREEIYDGMYEMERKLLHLQGYLYQNFIMDDADTFTRDGGTEYFKIAQRIANFGQNSRFNGWSEVDGLQSRTSLINNILKADNKTLRTLAYQYHRNGLDMMAENDLRAKNAIGNVLLQLEYYTRGSYAQFYPLEIFMLAKKDEIGKIFGGGQVSTVDIEKLKEILNTISPKNTSTWSNLKK